MKLTDISVQRPITITMLYIGIIVVAIVSYVKIPLDLFPDIEFPVAVVFTEYPNVGPKEIESTVTRPLEEALSSVNNIDTITSTSKEGLSMIVAKFTWGTDMGLAVSDMRERIDIRKRFLPDDVENPVVLKFDTSMMPVVMLSVTGPKDLAYVKKYAEDNLKNLFEQTDGVAAAYVSGGQSYEVKVELIKNRIDAYKLTIDQIIQLLAAENLNIAGGDVKTPYMKYTLRTQGEFKSLDDIRNVVVTVKNGTPIYVRDIARVYLAPADVKEIVRLNGENGVILRVQKQSDKNTVIVARNILKKAEEVRKTLPKGMDIQPFFNAAEFIELSISNMIKNAVEGALIAILVVLVILRNMRAALIMGLSIPVSIITSFVLMYFFDLSLNMMSMGGLAIGVGMLIDNSIVVLENIFRYREKGARPNEASKLGADEMGMAITASTLTNLVVFVPFLFSQGLAVQLFKDMALTITFSMLSSLVVALSLVPMLAAKFIPRIEHTYTGKLSFLQPLFDRSEQYFIRLERFYGKVINWALDHRRRVIRYVAISFVIGLIMIPIAGMEFMPEYDDAQLTIVAKLPVGTNLETTESVMKMIEKRALDVLKKEEYVVVLVRAGYGEGFTAAFGETTDYTGKIEMRLVQLSKRKRSKNEIRQALREAFKGIPGVTFNFSLQGKGGRILGMGGATISIEVYGYDFEKSSQYVEDIRNAIKNIPGLKDIDVSREEGLPEKVIVVNREKASKMGVNAYQIANLIKNNVAGYPATRYRFEGDEYDINVRLREADRETIEHIKSIEINTPIGKRVPVGNLIEIVTKSGPSTIERKMQERVVYLNCKAEGRALSAVVSDINKAISKLPKPANFDVVIAGAYKDMQDTFQDLLLVMLVAMVLTYVILAAQFESLLRPFIVMFSVPTVIFGVSLFLFLTGTTFNVFTFLGVIMLVGIVVNNAIVLVDYTDILRKRGYGIREALVEAGTKRLRPIMMTTLTTILSLIPMASGLGEGSELSSPLARAVMGGMSTAFIFTLVFIPVMYMIFETIRERYEARRKY
ncbi:MAG TPA: efflux RND transporter permease subunit [Spirochaetota bacterium]|nr:efflux RND transporter permease subunit [Spirochaetota bacterium]HOM11292.1 efflux RND transporter permease subunit [Spirochaetota bacterium]